MKLWIKYLFVFLLFTLIFRPQIVNAWPGCCSHHGGVCGCGCCDGTGLSSTCAPHYPECSGSGGIVIPTSKPIIIPTRVPTQRPTPTYKPIPTVKPTSRPKPTLKPTLTIKPSPTEVVLPTKMPSITPSPIPTQPVIPTTTYVPQVKSTESQSIFSRFFAWLFNRH